MRPLLFGVERIFGELEARGDVFVRELFVGPVGVGEELFQAGEDVGVTVIELRAADVASAALFFDPLVHYLELVLLLALYVVNAARRAVDLNSSFLSAADGAYGAAERGAMPLTFPVTAAYALHYVRL